MANLFIFVFLRLNVTVWTTDTDIISSRWIFISFYIFQTKYNGLNYWNRRNKHQMYIYFRLKKFSLKYDCHAERILNVFGKLNCTKWVNCQEKYHQTVTALHKFNETQETLSVEVVCGKQILVLYVAKLFYQNEKNCVSIEATGYQMEHTFISNVVKIIFIFIELFVFRVEGCFRQI